MALAAAELEARVQVIAKLAHIFRFERLVYLVTTTTSVVILLVSAVFLIHLNAGNWEVIAGLFGSSGLIGLSLVRQLRMWDQAITLLAQGDARPSKQASPAEAN
jgi:hypothetical protein